MESIKGIGVLTSGGDAPGMNACIRAVVKRCLSLGIPIFGIEDGFQGLIEGRVRSLNYEDVNNCIQLGGTILGSARSEAFRTAEGRKQAFSTCLSSGISHLIIIGGDGSFAGGALFHAEFGIPVIGIPGTIDNDIKGTDYTIGFDTALNTIISAVDRVRDTANSHHRVFFIEVMGRNAGRLAAHAALASGAEEVLVPEEVTDIEQLAKEIQWNNHGKRSSIIIVAEGDDKGGAKMILEQIRPYLPGFDLRYSVLGHIQRGGSPSVIDRIWATRMGILAVEAIVSGQKNKFTAVQSADLTLVSFANNTNSSEGEELEMLEAMVKMRTLEKKS